MSNRAEIWSQIVRGERNGLGARLARLGLRGLSVPYGISVRTRNKLFDCGWKTSHRAGVPVVCVGNLTLGGTGKTPCVEYVAGFYRDLGVQVAILSRGYGAEQGRNDEAMILEENLPDVPHLQGPDRVALAQTAVEELESELLVLDDGFQHRRLHRDLDIVLVDATRPIHRDRLFPAGTLREPLSGLRRAEVVMLTRTNQADTQTIDTLNTTVRKHTPNATLVTAIHAPIELMNVDGMTAPLETLHGRPIATFCGIGNPNSFRQTMADVGGNVVESREFPDHHPYSRVDVEALERWANSLPADAIVATTQKDFVKLRIGSIGGKPLWAVRVGMKLTNGEAEFQERLRQVSQSKPEA